MGVKFLHLTDQDMGSQRVTELAKVTQLVLGTAFIQALGM